jgi:hypothetical protein
MLQLPPPPPLLLLLLLLLLMVMMMATMPKLMMLPVHALAVMTLVLAAMQPLLGDAGCHLSEPINAVAREKRSLQQKRIANSS